MRKLAQYRGPTAEADATAVRDAQDEAYAWAGHHATVRRTGAQGMAIPHWTGVEKGADGVFAVHVTEDAEDGIPATRAGNKITGERYGLLTGALHRQRSSPDWDPEKPASVAEVSAAAAKETTARNAYDAQLALSPGDLRAAALAAKEAVTLGQAEELGPIG